MGEIDDAALDTIERRAFTYFLHEIHPTTGLVRDNTRRGAPASIAGSGFALASYAVGAERGYIARHTAAEHVRRALRFLWDAPQGNGPMDTGAHGFFYHFLALDTGQRLWRCELSTIDSAIAIAGVLTAGQYFDRDVPVERDIRQLAASIYGRVDWAWSMADTPVVSQGWRPESGFLATGWRGYNEALLLYILGLGSSAHRLPRSCYSAWTETYRWRRIYGQDLLYAGPLFIHQLSQIWVDFREIQDDFMRHQGIDYFENSRRATYLHQMYAARNPRRWDEYSATHWGITASDGPGPALRRRQGRRQTYFGYHARGAPFGPDDGTLSPWSVVSSLPFAPEIVLPAIRALTAAHPETRFGYGYASSFNPSFRIRRPRGSGPASGRETGWVSPAHYAINQGPVVLMIENYRSGLVWRLMRQCPCIANGLRQAGFRGGWLGHSQRT